METTGGGGQWLSPPAGVYVAHGGSMTDELDLPEGLSPEVRARLADDRRFTSLEDEDESVHDGTLPGADGQHGWDIWLQRGRVTNAEMLAEWLDRVGMSLEEFKKEEAFRANYDHPDFEWLRDL